MKKTESNTSKKSKIYRYACCGLMAAILCILAPLVVPIGPIPISLTNLVLYFFILILGTRESLISYSVYLLLGIVGLPVFSGYTGGPAKVLGPTGGYLLGFYPMLLIMGLCFTKSLKQKPWLHVCLTYLGMVLGTIIAYAFGTAWYIIQSQGQFSAILDGSAWIGALTICVFPFIPFDLGKMAIAILLGQSVRLPLKRAGMID